ncbi:crossover junction endodeoxyribonuclease [Alkalispirochaeta odontotermitis]|nr:crossover junction endodeoxyribonuclease [Alkalispirochaeta odontotermitis]CAB1079187.1 Crossover junction endodeoxyribonuclease RuvC (EC [Olavius algarvensis Delta 1 endosymbiont]
MITIIGIDPGLAATGVGIVQGSGHNITGYSFGSINTLKSNSLPNRLDHVYSKLFQILDDKKPDLMVVEDVFSLAKYPKSGITLGQVTGVVMLAGWQAGVSTVEIPVREAKQVLTGNGNASKMQLEESVRHRLKHQSPIKPYHASDALGLALIGFYRYYENYD